MTATQQKVKAREMLEDCRDTVNAESSTELSIAVEEMLSDCGTPGSFGDDDIHDIATLIWRHVLLGSKI